MYAVRRSFVVILIIVMSFFLFSCSSSNKNEKESKKIVEKYFDALKYGSREDELKCYPPSARKKEDALFGVIGQVSKLLIKVDSSDTLRNLYDLYDENDFSAFRFKVEQVILDQEEKNAAVYVSVSKDGEFVENIRVNTVKYDGTWYVEYNSISPDDRDPNEVVADKDSGVKTHWWTNRIWWIVVGGIAVIALLIGVITLINNNKGRRNQDSNDWMS